MGGLCILSSIQINQIYQMKRILYITYDWWFDTDVDILKSLSENYVIDVFVVSIQAKQLNKYSDKKVPSANVCIHDFPIWNKKQKTRMAFKSMWLALRIAARAKSYDLVLYIDDANPVSVLLLSLFLPKRKTIVTFHDYRMHLDEPRFKRMVHNGLVRSFRYFHFFSQSQYEYFAKDHSEKSAFFSLMPLKDFGLVKPYMIHEKKTFLFFGYIRDYKRLDLFIQAAKRLQTDARFLIAGYCADWERYEQLIDGDERFECHIGFVPNDEIPSYFGEADFLVLPYNDSTQSGPLLIAVNYGLPVIASRHKIFEDFIAHGRNGYLFEDSDVDDLAKMLRCAVKMSDEQYSCMRQAMCEARKEYEQKSDYCKALEHYVSLNVQRKQ